MRPVPFPPRPCPPRASSEKTCVAPDSGWQPVSGKDRAQSNAPRLLRILIVIFAVGTFRHAVNALLEDGGWLEHHDATRRDWNFLAGLRIAADPLAFLSYNERAKRRQLHRFASFEAIGDLLQHKFHKCGGFGARQTYLLVDRLAKVRACDRLCAH